MKNIFKQLEGLATNSKKSDFEKAVIKLTAYYSAGIFFILVIFSFVIYMLFTKGLDDDFDLDHPYGDRDQEFHEAVKVNLFDTLLFSDLVLFGLTIGVSYLLSRKTLSPLENVYRQQKRFVADAAHELRTPLAVQKAGAEVLLQNERSEEEYKKFIAESLEETNKLITLSNDLLFLAQSENAQNNPQKISLSDICNKKSEQIKVYAQRKNILLKTKIEDSVFVLGIDQDYERLVLNILKNAVDYTQEGSVTLSLQKKDSRACLIIEDTGVGIDEENLKHIFERFYKIDSARTQKQSSGTGLGLSIVDEIVKKYNGTISVKSALGKGTTFEVCLLLG